MEFDLPERPAAAYTGDMAIERTVKEIRGLTVEEILGKKLQDEQKVYIVVYSDTGQVDEVTRQQAFDDMRRLSAKAAKNIQDKDVSDEELGEVIDEAIEHVRHRKP